MGARGDTLAVFLDSRFLQAVETADQIVPSDRHVDRPSEVDQLLLRHQREERAEDVAPDRRVARVVDRTHPQLDLRPFEQIFHPCSVKPSCAFRKAYSLGMNRNLPKFEWWMGFAEGMGL